MQLILDGIKTALVLIFSFDAEVFEVTLLSLKISSSATLASLFTGVPAGLSIILLTLAFGVNYLLTLIQQRERPR